MKTITEKTSSSHELRFRDENELLVEPTMVDLTLKVVENGLIIKKYSLNDLIKEETGDGPVYILNLTKTDNKSYTNKSEEEHALIIDWSYNNGNDGATLKYSFIIENLAVKLS